MPANSTVQSGKDLNGKTIAVIALNGITHIAARAWIDQNGGDSATAKFIEVPPPAMPAASAICLRLISRLSRLSRKCACQLADSMGAFRGRSRGRLRPS